MQHGQVHWLERTNGMDDFNYTELAILQAAELPQRTPFCPEDQAIAEYFDGVPTESERINLERHLAQCRYCRARIGMLERLEERHASIRAPGAVLAMAKQLKHETPVRRRRLAPAWAAAAVLVITLFMLAGREQQLGLQPATPVPAAPAEENPSQLRSVNRNVTAIDVLFPQSFADIKPGSLIQWSDVPGHIHYTIFVLSNAGDVLWTERLNGTQWLMQDSLQLVAAGAYYFRVEAQLPTGRIVSSQHVPFTFMGRK
jgi:predicted anti-sigma-YlaC factor YlaD